MQALIGRERLLAALDRAARGAVWVSVVGPGGVGKTRLVHAWAATQSGVVWIDAASARDRSTLLAMIGLACSVSLSACRSDEEAIAVIGSALAHAAPPLVLDNLEQMVEEARWVADRLAPLLGAPVVATTRERLRCDGEELLRVGPLAMGDAVALYRRAASDACASAAIEDSQQDVRALVHRLDCLPLAIELAAANASVLRARQVLDQVDHLSALKNCIAWSWELLSGEEQDALAQLSLFQGRFTALDAERLIGSMAPLVALQRKSLLKPITTPECITFSVWESVRIFLADRAEPDPAAYIEVVLDRAEPLAACWGSNAWPEARKDLLRWSPDLQWIAEQGRGDSSVRALLAWRPIMWVHATAPSRVRHVERVALTTRSLEVALWYAHALYQIGRLAEAHQVAVQGETDAIAANEPIWAGRLASCRGLLEGWLVDTDTACATHERAVAALRAEPSVALGRALLALGSTQGAAGRSAQAAATFEDARTCAFEIGDAQTECLAWLSIVGPAAEIGNRVKVDEAFERAKGLAAALGDDELEHRVHCRRVIFESWRGDPHLSLQLLPPALAWLRRTGHVALEAGLQVALVQAQVLCCQSPEQTAASFAEAEASQLRVHYVEGLAWVRLTLTTQQIVAGTLSAARKTLNRAAEAARASKHTPAEQLAHALEHLLNVQSRPVRDEEVGEYAPLLRSLDDPARLQAELALAQRPGQPSNLRMFALAIEAVSSRARERAILTVGMGVVWFERATTRVDLRRRHSARRILTVLIDSAQAAPGETVPTQALIASGWPAEQMQPRSAMVRLHTTIRWLRKKGLRTWLVTGEGGYYLDPMVAVTRRGTPSGETSPLSPAAV